MSIQIQIETEKIKKFCQSNGIRNLSIFGSALRDDFHAESDVDILVEFQPHCTPDLFKLIRLENELSSIFGGKKMDLITEKFLNRHIQNQVLEQQETLYAEV